MDLIELGKILRTLREKAGKTMQTAAFELEVDRSYLSKVESGKEKPSEKFLHKINTRYDLSLDDYSSIFKLSGYRENVQNKTGKEVQKNMEEGQNSQQEVQVEIPQGMDVLYCDSVIITSSPYGVILSFAQTTASPTKQKVISRIGMSKTHGQALVKALQNNLEASEKVQPLVVKRAVS